MQRLFAIVLSLLSLGIFLIGVHLARLPPGELWIDFLNIGQGDAILITTPEWNRVLIDGGPDQKVLRELGEVMPVLHREIDLVVLTHPDLDHVMGLVPVLERYDVGAVLFSGVNHDSFAYEAFLEMAAERGIPVYAARAEVDWRFGEGADAVYLDVLYPFEPQLAANLSNVNNASVIMMVRYGDHRILLTGDAEKEVETELVAEMQAGRLDLRADVLKAGHHGSRTSSTHEFVEAVAPEVAVISCGLDNDFGHPHQETLSTFEDLDVEVRRTDLEGRVRITFNQPSR